MVPPSPFQSKPATQRAFIMRDSQSEFQSICNSYVKGSTLFSLTDLGHLSRFSSSFITSETKIKKEVCGTQSESFEVLRTSRETEYVALTMEGHYAILITNSNNRTASSYKIRCISVLLLMTFNIFLRKPFSYRDL